MQAELAAAKKELGRLAAAADAIREEGKKAQASELETSSSLLEARSLATALQEELAGWKATAEAAQAGTGEVQAALQKARSRETTLKNEVAAAEDTAELWRSAADAAQEDVQARERAFENELAAATEEWTRWKVEAKAAREECAALMAELRALKGMAEEVEQEQEEQQQQWESSSTSALVRQASNLSLASGVPDRFFLIELGSWRIRAGWVEVGSPEKFNPMHFPCVVARPKKASANYSAIVQNASISANPMYARFREDGVFIGKDAWYCAFDHPDPVLRGALKLEAPFVRDRLERPADLKWLLKDVLVKMDVDAWESPLVVTYKATTTPEERAKMVEMMFEPCEASR